MSIGSRGVPRACPRAGAIRACHHRVSTPERANNTRMATLVRVISTDRVATPDIHEGWTTTGTAANNRQRVCFPAHDGEWPTLPWRLRRWTHSIAPASTIP